MHKTKIVNPPKHFYFLISTFISVSQGDRYLGMTAAMTQIPVPTATHNCRNTVTFGFSYNFFLQNSLKIPIFAPDM